MTRVQFYFTFFLFFLFVGANQSALSQEDENDTYRDYWEKVDSLQNKGLYRAALTTVHTIFNQASQSKDHQQVIKSVLFELKYNSYLEEDDYVLGINRLEKLIIEAPSPSKEILHSVLAEVYWGYYSANIWKFSERTTVAEVEPEDVRTWDLKRIAVKIRNHYALSLMNAPNSQKAPIEDFSTIIKYSDETTNIRPTLYDFLGHRALDFFKNNSFDIAGPAVTFGIADKAFFDHNAAFLKFNVATKDSLNTTFLAARVLRALTSFHDRKKNHEALFYLELERLQFAYAKSILPNKEELYYNGLTRLTEANKKAQYAAEAWYHIAKFHNNKGQEFRHDRDTTLWNERIKAVEVCKRTMENYASSHGARQCAALLASIQEKSLAAEAEEGIYPNTVSKFLLNYRNLEKIHVKIVKMDYDKLKSGKYRGDKFYKFLQKEKGVYEKEIDLNTPLDYNPHSQELEIPALPHGFYYLVLSSDGRFEREDKTTGFASLSFWSTSITYQSRKNKRKREILVSNRRTGEPLAGAKVKITYQEYNSPLSKYVTKTVGNFKTDEKGKCSFDRTRAYKNYNLEVTYGGETYDPDATIYDYRYYESAENHTETRFFTDRKIYRPGQSIFFKGIVVDYEGKERLLKKNYSTTVYFYDVNGQEIAKKEVKTNQFGSFEGRFEAPFGVLNGQMRISDKNGHTYIRVEEYKRPKFFLKADPVEGEYSVNDSITITGVAEAYAGNKIDGAAVTYRVVRSTEWNRFDWWGWYPNVPPREVDQGTLTTDDEGAYSITFKAVPDQQSDPKSLPVFNYTVHVDVTDINGETHSTSSSVRVGYHSLQLGNNIPGDLNGSKDFMVKIAATNLNYQPIDAAGQIMIDRLKSPNQPFYNRLWEAPDQQQWTREAFKAKFPHAVYENENEMANWPVEKSILETSFNTAINDSIVFENLSNWEPGVYRYIATAKDKRGVEVMDVKYFTVFHPDSKTPADNEVLKVRLLNTSAEPGEKVTVLLSSTEENVRVVYETEANENLIESKEIVLNNEQVKLEFEIKESYRGNLTIHFSTIRNNRHFGSSKTVYVPYTNKQLDLAFATFRDKLKPGQKEEWTLTVKNKKGGKEQAEFLATLYDASLDELYTPNSFYFNIYQSFYGQAAWGFPVDFSTDNASNINYSWSPSISYPERNMPVLNYFGWSSYYYNYNYGFFGRGSGASLGDGDSMALDDMEEMEEADEAPMAEKKELKWRGVAAETIATGNATTRSEDANGEFRLDNQQNKEDKDAGGLNEVKARTNFNETAFFYPQLMTNQKGEVKIKFTISESLTKWKFLGLAHTQDLKTGTISEEVVTQKELMVVPNVPRFLREGDQMILSAKISNISEDDLSGSAQLILLDPFTEKPIGKVFQLANEPISFEADKGKSTVVSWAIQVPTDISTVRYKFVAKAGDFEDGESDVLPILSNRMLVTESMPMPIRGEETKNFTLDKMKKTGLSATLKHHQYTLEFTSNPAWYALQAMPYMMEYPHECAEQTFTRYYSNTIAAHIMNTNPKIKEVIQKWGEDSPDAFLSNLEKNQELKAVMLEETPWVLQANTEEETKRNLAILLDMERMSREMDKAFGKIMKSQGGNGGWAWFPGMKENRYITQHIVTGMGHLDHLGIKEVHENRGVWKMTTKAIEFLDKEIVDDFEDAKRWDPDYQNKQHIGYTQIQYLYARSYFMDVAMNDATREAVQYYKNQAVKYWLEFNLYAEGMIALAAHRFDMSELANDIVKSLKDRSIQNEEFGMYWKDYYVGYYWYEAPIETQALMIELFDEVADDQKVVEELKIWLLKEKQTTHWKTTKQTTEAVYALLLKGSDLLASDDLVNITVGGKAIEYTSRPESDNPYQVNPEAGTGYFKTAWEGKDITASMADIKVSKTSKGVAWGAVYWQYFEDLDNITFAETNLKLQKDLYRLEVTPEGEQLVALSDNAPLEIGDKVRVRIELRTDRNLEYVHMKDMRAAGFEPLNVLSAYRYQDRLGYYQSTKDAATHFFFDYIRKGTYVFEYDLRVQHKGDFSNGIATIQCMYAPEFTSHSDGIRVRVE